jgi:hypothetical protein
MIGDNLLPYQGNEDCRMLSPLDGKRSRDKIVSLIDRRIIVN